MKTVTQSRRFRLYSGRPNPGATQETALPAASVHHFRHLTGLGKNGERQGCPFPLIHSRARQRRLFTCHFPQKSGLFSADSGCNNQLLRKRGKSTKFSFHLRYPNLSRLKSGKEIKNGEHKTESYSPQKENKVCMCVRSFKRQRG